MVCEQLRSAWRNLETGSVKGLPEGDSSVIRRDQMMQEYMEAVFFEKFLRQFEQEGVLKAATGQGHGIGQTTIRLSELKKQAAGLFCEKLVEKPCL